MRDNVYALYAAGYGALTWLGIMMITGQQEAWDSELYWFIGQPALFIGAGILGWLAPQKAWRWGLWMNAGQMAMLLVSGILGKVGFGLLPVGLITFGILAIPLIVISSITAFVRRKFFSNSSNG